MQGLDDANIQTVASRCVFSFRFAVGILEPDAAGSTVDMCVNTSQNGWSCQSI
jgi:hypothetical protein